VANRDMTITNPGGS